MKRIAEDIASGSYRRCYLLYGSEDYLKIQYKNKIKNALFPDGDTMNVTIFSDKDVTEEEIINSAGTMPFFAEKRLVIAENTGFFGRSCENLPTFIGEIPESTVLVFVEDKADKRNGCYKAVEKNGLAVEFSMPDTADLKKWVMGRLKKENLEITGDALEEFVQRTCTDMVSMESELDKLVSYCMNDGKVTKQDVCDICIPQLQGNIWKMIDAFVDQNPKAAHEWYRKLLEAKEQPLGVLNLMERHFRLMLMAAQLNSMRVPTSDILRKLKIQDFALRNYLRQSKHFDRLKVQEILNRMADLEQKAKSGKIEAHSAVEILIEEYSRKNTNNA